MINGRYCFRGFSNSLIFWEDEMKQWKFVDFADNQMNSAVTRGKEYPFGRKNWLFEKNPCKNDEEDYDPMRQVTKPTCEYYHISSFLV